MKIILANGIKETAGYLRQNSLWLNRHFVILANRDIRVCLTLDYRGNNPNSLGRFRTKADNPKEETCYFNIENNNKL